MVLEPVAHLGSSLEAAMQGRARQVRDRRLQGMEAVIQWQQRVFAEGNDHRLFLYVTTRLAPPARFRRETLRHVHSDVATDVSYARRGDAGRGFGCRAPPALGR